MSPPAKSPEPALITASVPTPLRKHTKGAAEVKVPALDLRELLAELEKRHPDFHRCICDETGALRQHINLWVDSDHMRELDGLDTRLQPGNYVTIMTAVSGG